MFIVLTLILIGNLAVADDWKPPPDPVPKTILHEAREDRQAGRYADALAKHIWFHEHALTIEPSLTGVRLSFALSDWKELADLYPPALAKLREFRDEAGTAVQGSADPFRAFMDFRSLNRVLKEDRLTLERFLEVERQQPEIAVRLYPLVKEDLIRLQEYEICARYLDPSRFYFHLGDYVRHHQKSDRPQRLNAEARAYLDRRFMNETAELVGLLVINDRREEAEKIAAHARLEITNPDFLEQLDQALKGIVPGADSK